AARFRLRFRAPASRPRGQEGVSRSGLAAFCGTFPAVWTRRPRLRTMADGTFPRRDLRRVSLRRKGVLTMVSIVRSPNPILNTVCEPCELDDKSLRKLARQMAKAMYKNDGCGLAAPQLGVTKRLVVVDCDQEDGEQNPLVLVNPVLVETQGDPVVEGEGCLSCPGISVPIARPPFARVRYFDLDGEEWEIEGDGLLGRCLQHELDHLDGVTMFERCDPLARIQALRDYELALAAAARPGEP